jgi:hypothetical protein
MKTNKTLTPQAVLYYIVSLVPALMLAIYWLKIMSVAPLSAKRMKQNQKIYSSYCSQENNLRFLSFFKVIAFSYIAVTLFGIMPYVLVQAW